MNIEAQRKSIIHRILDVKNEELLSKIDELSAVTDMNSLKIYHRILLR